MPPVGRPQRPIIVCRAIGESVGGPAIAADHVDTAHALRPLAEGDPSSVGRDLRRLWVLTRPAADRPQLREWAAGGRDRDRWNTCCQRDRA